MADVIYKPLNESVQTETIEVKPKLQTICYLYGKFISEARSLTGTTSTTFYTVPKGKIFLLLTANLSQVHTGAGTGFSNIGVNVFTGGGTSGEIVRIQVEGASSNASISPTFPFLVREGFNINLSGTGALTETSGCIVGYELDAGLFYKSL